jgi:hypothetical protein
LDSVLGLVTELAIGGRREDVQCGNLGHHGGVDGENAVFETEGGEARERVKNDLLLKNTGLDLKDAERAVHTSGDEILGVVGEGARLDCTDVAGLRIFTKETEGSSVLSTPEADMRVLGAGGRKVAFAVEGNACHGTGVTLKRKRLLKEV